MSRKVLHRKNFGPSPHGSRLGVGHALRVAWGHHRAGRLPEAERMYQRILREHPYDPDALHLRGLLAHEIGAHGAAQVLLEKAIAVNPREASYHFDLGRSLQTQGKWDEAVASYTRAVSLRPDFVAAYVNLGNLHQRSGQLPQALACYQQALHLEPALAEAHSNLGALYYRLGRLDEAVAAFQQALSIQPSLPEAHNNLGNVLQELGRHHEAVASYRCALAERPDYVEAHRNLGAALNAQGRTLEALVAYQQAQVLAPDAGTAFRMSTLLPPIPASVEDLRFFRSRFEAEADRLADPSAQGLTLEDPAAEVGVTSFFLAYHGQDDRPLQEKVAQLYLRACPSLASAAPHCLPGRQGPVAAGRVRVGFVSRYFHNHTVGRFNLGLVQHLSRERFDVTVVHLGKRDEFSQWVAQAADHAYHVGGSLRSLREFVASQEFDVLIYPEIGMDALTYFLAFARLAPVQCATWGHPVTTGIPNMDYFISSEALEPADAGEHYSERLVRLRHLPTYYYRPEVVGALGDRARLGFPEDSNLYICPQSLFKLHPEFDRMWGDILRRDPRGRLVLIEGANSHWTTLLRDRLGQANPDVAERILFVPRLDGSEYFNLLSGADVLLDPPHFGGGNTTYEALALGVPIVTWPGAFMRGRVTSACYQQMGVLDCVVTGPEDYVDVATRLANDRAWRDDVRSRILAANHVLYENDGAVREIEAFLAEALAAAATGRLIDWRGS